MAEPLYPFLTMARLRMEIDGEGVTTLVAGAGCPQYLASAGPSLHLPRYLNQSFFPKPGS